MEMIEKLVALLHKGIVSFTYIKKDGTRRHAEGTLYGVGHTLKGSKASKCPYVLNYYDVDCQGWRCFIIKNLIEVGDVRHETPDEHHEICLALVVKLKDKMKKEGATAFAYRKKNGEVRHAHGIISDDTIIDGKYIEYFDTDKNEMRKFCLDSFIGIGEPEEVEDYIKRDRSEKVCEDGLFATFHSEESNSRHRTPEDNGSLDDIDIKSILSRKGIEMEDVENVMIIDLIPELNKTQLRDLIIRATERLAEI